MSGRSSAEDDAIRIIQAAARRVNGRVIKARRGQARARFGHDHSGPPLPAPGTRWVGVGLGPATGASSASASAPGPTTWAGLVLGTSVRPDRDDGTRRHARDRRMAPPTRRRGASGTRA